MRAHVILKCEERFIPKARYVFSTFLRVLGLDVIELAGEEHQTLISSDGPIVWYGPATEMPPEGPGIACIHASPEASTFFTGHVPRRVEDTHIVPWRERRVPFLFGTYSGSVQPLDSLLAETSHGMHMPYDVIASAFYFLSRWEETVLPDRDRHGRFPYAQSLAAQLNIPENIVDEYLDLFVAVLNRVNPGLWPQLEIPVWEDGAHFVACLTHDVDEISKSRLSRLKFLWDHVTRPEAGHRNTPLRERVRAALGTLVDHQDPYWTFPTLAEMERRFGFTASYFFQAGGDKYSLSEPRVQVFMSDLLRQGFEVGLHGTYRAAFDEHRFLREKATLATAINQEPVGHRQHYLRMDYAATLPIYERAALEYDATLGYAEQSGYRNEFSYPYHPYNHDKDRPFRFLELPTVIMDATLGGYQEVPSERAWQIIEAWLERTRRRRGCITLLWHNPWDGVLPGYFDLYPRILAWIDEHGGRGLSGRDVVRLWQAR